MNRSAIQAGSLQYYISDLVAKSSDRKSGLFRTSFLNFQQFIKYQYDRSVEQNEETTFLNDLFLSISISQLGSKTKSCVTLLHALIDVKLGDKLMKSNRMIRDLGNFHPCPDKKTWKLLKKILVYVSGTLRSSFQLALVPLRHHIVKWTKSSIQEEAVSGFMLLSVVFECFSHYYQAYFYQSQRMLLNGLMNSNDSVSESAFSAFKKAIKYTHKNQHFNIEGFCNNIRNSFKNQNFSSFKNLIRASEYVLFLRPDLIRCFSFESIPVDLLLSKDNSHRVSSFHVFPFAFRTASHLFNAHFEVIYKQYIRTMKKRSTVRNEGMESFGKFIFAHSGFFDDSEISYLKDCIDLVKDSLDINAGVFSYLSLLTVPNNPFGLSIDIVFQQPITPLIVKGLIFYNRILPENSIKVQEHLLTLMSPILLNSKSPSEPVLFALNSIFSVEVPYCSISESTILRFSLLLEHQDYSVRKMIGRFITEFQISQPSLFVLIRLLSVISNENNQKLRLYLFKRINHSIYDASFIEWLVFLLQDSQEEISIEALRNLVRFLDYSSVFEIVKEYLSEQYSPLSYSSQIRKYMIECFLVISEEAIAGNNQSIKAKELLQPYASDLMSKLFSFSKKVPVDAIKLLSHLISIMDSDFHVTELIGLLFDSLSVHSSFKRLDYSLDLLISALNNVSLRLLIYKDNVGLIKRLHSLSRLPKNEVSRIKLLKGLSMIGPISSEMISSFLEQSSSFQRTISTNCATYFVSQSESNDPLSSLVFATIGIALSHIFDILSDDFLSTIHPLAFDALIAILKSNRNIEETYQNELVHRIILMLKSDRPISVSFLISNLSTLIAVLGNRCSPLFPHIVSFIEEKWDKADKASLIRASEWMMNVSSVDFEPFLPKIADLYLSELHHFMSKVVNQIFVAFITFGRIINTIGSVVFPCFCEWLLAHSSETSLCSDVLGHIRSLLCYVEAQEYSGLMIRTMIKLIQINSGLLTPCQRIIALIGCSLGTQFLVYTSLITQSFTIEEDSELKLLIDCYKKKIPIPEFLMRASYPKIGETTTPLHRQSSNHSILPKELPSITIPKPEWDEDKWTEWNDDFLISLFRQSDSRPISACASLAQRNPAIRNALFPVAFLLLYLRFKNINESDFRYLIEVVFTSKEVPNITIRLFTAVIELFEVLEIEIPISIEIVARRSYESGLLPQSLRWYEIIYEKNNSEKYLKEIILINNEIGLSTAATSALEIARRKKYRFYNEEIAEKLGLWDDALKFNSEQSLITNDPYFFKGKLRCMRNLMLFDEILCEQQCFPLYSSYALFCQFKFAEFDNEMELVTLDEESTLEHLLYSSIHGDTERSTMLYEKIIVSNTKKLFPGFYEEFDRVYYQFLLVSLANEAKEVSFLKSKKQFENSIEFFEKKQYLTMLDEIKEIWKIRFSKLPCIPQLLLLHIALRSSIISVSEQIESFIKFIDSAVEKKNYRAATRCIDLLEEKHPCDLIQISKAKLMISMNNISEAVSILNRLGESRSINSSLLLGQCLYKEGNYLQSHKVISSISDYFDQHSEMWNTWSQVNMALFHQTQNVQYLKDSFHASINGILRGSDDLISLMLRILNILFLPESSYLYSIFEDAISDLPLKQWVLVLPHIFALLYSQDKSLRLLISLFIEKIGSENPNPVLYSLLIPIYSSDCFRQHIGNSIMEKMQLKYPNVSNLILIMSKEWIRISTSWWEFCNFYLDSASSEMERGDYNAMLKILKDLHTVIDENPVTYMEICFKSENGISLSKAFSLINGYQETNDECYLHSAWKYYSEIYATVQSHIELMNTIDLSDASPKLYNIKESGLSIPGNYHELSKTVSIQSFKSEIMVIKSKQRPRKIIMNGSDGKEYSFLLKSREDTRLDERLMQLFICINSMINGASIQMKDSVLIETYNVTPISNSVGLIGWVENCNTLYDMVKKSRKKKSISIEAEYELCLKNNPSFELLKGEQRRDAFLSGFEATDGNDIRQLLFTGSLDTVDWIKRRNYFTGSLSATSIIGYIVGLGDRHMSNIMLKRNNGKLVHIDFGDCFEITMNRANYPEVVPFRLTRMLVNSLEVSGIEGSFKKLCIDIFNLMKKNREMIIGLMDSFIYDPIHQQTFQSNQASMDIINRIDSKINGVDFGETNPMKTEIHIERLISQAIDPNNLCQMYRGWFPWW